MLDLVGLPKNINGFRTTHTCELCGFEPKTKNKYREKQDHLVMKHFKEKIDKIFPHCRPYCCPTGDCAFTGKDKQALLRHYTGKHGILERYLREALAEKGINYAQDAIKRKATSSSSSSTTLNTNNGGSPDFLGGGSKSGKHARTSLSPSSPMAATTQEVIPNSPQRIIQSKPNTEELRKEVEAMMASFQPVEHQVVFTLPPVSAAAVQHHQHMHQDCSVVSPPTSEIVIPCTTPISEINISQLLASSTPVKPSPVQVTPPPSSVIKTPLPSIRTIVPPQVPLPSEVHNMPSSVTSCTAAAIEAAAASVVSSITTPVSLTAVNHHQHHHPTSSANVLENIEVMWGTGASAGPAVIVEAANAITFIESADGTTFTAANIESIDDYLYATPLNATEVRERQLDFCML